MTEEANKTEVPQLTSKDEVRSYLAELEKRVIDSEGAYLHSILALNHLLRLPNAAELIDDKMKAQMKDLWLKLKSTGIKLADPPLLFGLPENFGKEAVVESLPISGAQESK